MVALMWASFQLSSIPTKDLGVLIDDTTEMIIYLHGLIDRN